MASRIFLALSAVVWLPYGLFCFLRPDALADSAGILALGGTGSAELRAMYGGVQSAVGVLALCGALRPQAFARAALTTLAFLCAGLFVARVLGAALDAGFGAYTGVALGFEALSSAVAFALLRHKEKSDVG